MQKFVKSLKLRKLGKSGIRSMSSLTSKLLIPQYFNFYLNSSWQPVILMQEKWDSNTNKLSAFLLTSIKSIFFHLPFTLVRSCNKGFSASNISLKGENLLFLNPTLLFSPFHFQQTYNKVEKK